MPVSPMERRSFKCAVFRFIVPAQPSDGLHNDFFVHRADGFPPPYPSLSSAHNTVSVSRRRGENQHNSMNEGRGGTSLILIYSLHSVNLPFTFINVLCGTLNL